MILSRFVSCAIPAYTLLIAALGLPHVYAQTIPAIGTDATLDVMSWNIEDFGDPNGGPSNDNLQRQNVQAVIEQSGVDLFALQELNDENTFNTLLADLGSEWEGVRVEDEFGNIGYGYIYNPDVIQSLQVNTILDGNEYEFAQRLPLLLRANVVLPDTTIEVRFIDLHMKAGGSEEDYDRRVAASQRLKNFVDNLIFIDEHVLILGDLNDELLLSIFQNRTSPYQNFLDDEDYFFVTRDFDMPGGSNDLNTYCSNAACTSGSVLDHIIATENLHDDYKPGSANHFIALIDAITSYTTTTSDHLPVYARFDFLGMGTPNEPGAPVQSFALEPAFPNPFTNQAAITFTMDEPGPILLEVLDGLGRRVAILAEGSYGTGTHRVALDAAHLRTGAYTVRLISNGQTAVQRIVRL